ncbi:MAG: AI-2E family transporter [Acidobacteriaceae bacterium]
MAFPQFRKKDVPPPLNLNDAPPQTVAEQVEQDEILRTSIQAGTFAQIVMTIAIVLVLVYYAKLPLIVICISILLAFILEPIVRACQHIKIPRPVGSLLALLIFAAALYGLSYFFYQRAADFAQQLPHYSNKIKRDLGRYERRASELQKTTESVMNMAQPQGQKKAATPVTVQPESTGLAEWLRNNFGTVSELVLTITFIPFLAYFMLTWGEHVRRSTVGLFNEEHRRAAYKTLGKISDMMRIFIIGNFYIGIFISAISIVVFGLLGLPYFYFTGVLSGFLSLVPYLGVLLAFVPPIATGLGHLTATHLIVIFMTVLGLHLFSMNVLYPKILGKRMDLNPLVVTLSLLIWGWIWGAMGLILAVPITAAIKIVCDNVEQLKPVGAWMGE